MRFGMLPYTHGSVEEDVNLAKLAEELNFGSYWIPDAVLTRDAYVALAQIACNTKRMMIGPETGPYIRHPAITANAVATLDEVSGGRIGLMMGIGHLRSLFSVGIQHRHEAIAIMEEAIQICRGVWSGKPFSYDGVRFKIRNLRIGYEFQKDFPIVLAATDPEMLEFTGTHADGVCANLTPIEYLQKAWNCTKEGLAKSGREPSDFRFYFQPLVAIAEDRDKARKAVEKIIFHSLFYVHQHDDVRESIGIAKEDLAPAIEASMREMAKAEARAKGLELVTVECASSILETLTKEVVDRLLDETTIYGTVEDVIERLKKYEKVGVRDVLIGPVQYQKPFETDISKPIKLIGEEIIPQFEQT